MTAARIDGKAIAQEILSNLRKRVKQITQQDITPHLVIILVGEDPASAAYVRQKELTAEKIGAKSTTVHLEASISQNQLLKIIEQYNNDNTVHGIIVQQPLPSQINTSVIVQIIKPEKDVDGFHSETSFPMPLAAAVIKILKHVYSSSEARSSRLSASNDNFEKWLQSQNIVVIGKGETGGRPVTQALKQRGANVAVIDSKTQNPKKLTKKATVIISAVGRKNIITPEMISKGVILVSVGLHKGEDDKLHGDYDEEEIAGFASFYTPTPGGVGPVNVAMLLENLLTAAEKQS